MREYRHPATDETIETLRRLRRAWTGYVVTPDTVVVVLADGGTVAIRADAVEVEGTFEAVRLTAAAAAPAPAAALEPPGAFADGGNDVVIFRSETWIEAAPDGDDAGEDDDGAAAERVVQFTGSPLQRSPTAAAVCAVDDAVVLASGAGTGLLVRCGLRPGALEVTRDPAVIGRFLVERQYAAG